MGMKPFVRRNSIGKIEGYASEAPPTAEAHLWERIEPDDPELLLFLNPAHGASLLDQAKQRKMAEIDRDYRAATEAGFESTALGATHRYSSLMENQLNLMGAVVAGIDMPYTTTNSLGKKEQRAHTAAQLRQVFQSGMRVKQTFIARAEQRRAAVEAATTIEQVEAIVF